MFTRSKANANIRVNGKHYAQSFDRVLSTLVNDLEVIIRPGMELVYDIQAENVTLYFDHHEFDLGTVIEFIESNKKMRTFTVKTFYKESTFRDVEENVIGVAVNERDFQRLVNALRNNANLRSLNIVNLYLAPSDTNIENLRSLFRFSSIRYFPYNFSTFNEKVARSYMMIQQFRKALKSIRE